MQENPSQWSDCGCNEPSTPDEDAQAQRAVMDLVLSEHPTQLTVCELAREISQKSDFAETDAVERAIRDLVGAGLLRCHGALVLSTRAALHFDRLPQS